MNVLWSIFIYWVTDYDARNSCKISNHSATVIKSGLMQGLAWMNSIKIHLNFTNNVDLIKCSRQTKYRKWPFRCVVALFLFISFFSIFFFRGELFRLEVPQCWILNNADGLFIGPTSNYKKFESLTYALITHCPN